MAKLPDYITMEEANVTTAFDRESKVLPVGSFVKPIDPYWLPRHIKTSDQFQMAFTSDKVYCFCHFGIVLLPRDILREV